MANQDRNFSTLQKLRHEFVPGTPSSIADVNNTKVSLKRTSVPIKDELQSIFPNLLAKGADGMQQLSIKVDNENGSYLKSDKALRIGCVLSGGQAAGGHNVIMGLYDMIKKLHPDSRLFGFLNGPHGIFTNNYMEIEADYMGLFRNTGGFDMIRSGRHKIETPQQFADSLDNCTNLDLDGLVVIGGDDSNTNACLLAEYFASKTAKTKVIGCPKTIDGDLKNEHIPVSFGFDTATKVYSEAIGNLCSDVISSKEYYHFVRLMGRSASHIALECALRTQINCVLIGEEVEAKKQTLSQVTTQVADIICQRSELGKNYGVVLVPEGLIEFIPEMSVLISEVNELLAKPFQGEIRSYVQKHLSIGSQALFNFLPASISNQLLLDRDPHGNVQVSKIDTEKLLILLLKQELKTRAEDGNYSGTFVPQSHFFGYEGRCALPSNFDSQYCYSLGLNAAVLIREGLSGYMSCIKNLTDKNPANWEAAGCPLPTMMGIERRHGKDKPVISKALVLLDGQMFKAYEAVRDKWAVLDCYLSPGPIQFQGAASDELNFMVLPPNVEELVKQTARYEEVELVLKKESPLYRDPKLLSELSQSRVKDVARIPDQLEKGKVTLAGVKKFTTDTAQIDCLLQEQFPILSKEANASYFVEAQDSLLTNTTFKVDDEDLSKLNEDLLNVDSDVIQKIGVVYLGRQAPGANNVVDGLIRFRNKRKDVTLVGFINGVEGLLSENYETIRQSEYQHYRNLGGIDYIGRSKDELRSKEDKIKTAEVCKKLGLTGLVLVGATHTLTDGVYLSQYFVQQGLQTRVIVVPCSVDGNIHHKYIRTSIGFDSASKVYSQLIGNMLTDSASAVKYWYFIRLMGQDPSHVALECALKTQPNMVIVSEEVADRKETLTNVVSSICDNICSRAAEGKNYGAVLIPEGLLHSISAFSQLIDELNLVFSEASSSHEFLEMQQTMSDDSAIKKILTPWSNSLFKSLPEFMKQQLLIEREMAGSIKLSQIETEKLVAFMVEEELKNRKKAGTYSGTFAPVSHFFGYQGRSGHPSHFDCSLASTMGFTAGCLIEAGLTGMAVSVNNVTKPASDWRVGGVPLLAMLSLYPKQGFNTNELVIRSEDVSLTGAAFQKMKVQSNQWRMKDCYTNPGPIQFYLDDSAENNKISMTINMMYEKGDDMTEKIRGLCHSIQNDCIFTEDQHLLHAALSSLLSAKQVINSLSHANK